VPVSALKTLPSECTSRPLFIGGLHRSGTSALAKAIAAHPAASGMLGTGANEDEGQFLQTILPLDTVHGGPARFAFDPAAHLTETSALGTEENAGLIFESWAKWWDLGKPLLVEKSPANLLRMRLLQRLFPHARFLMIVRHPIAVALATDKWVQTSLFSRIYHWVVAHEIAFADRRVVEHTLFVAYEDLAADPVAGMDRIWRFLDLPPGPKPQFEDFNPPYFAAWRAIIGSDASRAIRPHPRPPAIRPLEPLRRSIKQMLDIDTYRRGRDGPRLDALDAIAAFEPRVRNLGYSLIDFTQRPHGWPHAI